MFFNFYFYIYILFFFFLGRWMEILSCCSLSSEARGNILQLQENEWLQFLKLPFLNWFLSLVPSSSKRRGRVQP